ncbi:TPA: hypothetical protein ACH3X3_002503 [Trebouxia sp. C0006]
MAIFGTSAGNIVVTAVITWTLQRRVALATRLLRGLRCFTITAAGATSAKSVPTDSKNTPIPRPTKQQAAKAKKRDNDLGEANAVTTVPLSISQVESTAFYSYLDVAVLAVPAAIANYVLGEIQQALGFSGNFLPALAGAILIGLALRALLNVTMLTHLSPAFDKGCTVGFAILSGLAAMAVLTICPAGVLSFDTKLATHALSQATGALMRNKASTEAGKHMPDPSIDPLLLEIALALLGAMLGGLLLTPIMRITRSFASAVDPPEWGQDQMGLPSWLTLHLNLVLPAVATVIWVTPLFQEPLELPNEVMPKVKAAIMMCIAVVQLVNTRSLVQSYLNSGLRQWHSMKHGPPAGAAGTKTGEVIAFKLRVVNTLLVKVAIQCITPAIILTGCTIIILQHSDNGKSGILSSGNPKSAEILQIPISFWVCIADFCGWWTCTCWFLYGASFLTLIKSNLLQV